MTYRRRPEYSERNTTLPPEVLFFFLIAIICLATGIAHLSMDVAFQQHAAYGERTQALANIGDTLSIEIISVDEQQQLLRSAQEELNRLLNAIGLDGTIRYPGTAREVAEIRNLVELVEELSTRLERGELLMLAQSTELREEFGALNGDMQNREIIFNLLRIIFGILSVTSAVYMGYRMLDKIFPTDNLFSP